MDDCPCEPPQALPHATTEHQRQLVYAGAGVAAELMSSVIFVPTEVVKSKLQLGVNPYRATGGMVQATTNYRSAVEAVRHVTRTEGIRGLFSGWHASLLTDCVHGGLQFLTYENIRRYLRRKNKREPTWWESMLAGAAAGGVAGALTNPFDTITCRLMVQDNHKGFGSSFGGVVKAALAEGPVALWRGMGSRALHVMPVTALQFALFEQFREWFSKYQKKWAHHTKDQAERAGEFGGAGYHRHVHPSGVDGRPRSVQSSAVVDPLVPPARPPVPSESRDGGDESRVGRR